VQPQRVFIKEMEIYLRGRERGVIPVMIEKTLRDAGAPADVLEHCDSEMAAVRRALEWARPGDLLLLTTHAEREAVIALLQDLAGRGWTAGSGLASLAT
jgi:UDP-N-acetylmuramyl tripeptide synthase